MKKILFVIENLGSGGAQKQLYLICSGLIDVYDQITVYCYADYGKDFYTERLQSMGIRIVKQSNQGYIKRILSLRAFIKADTPTTLISFLYFIKIISYFIFFHFLSFYSCCIRPLFMPNLFYRKSSSIYF